eukprot:m.51476 g.51476  ORF g.51476 m.51476 type:complete len:196 (+) comp9054_c0_seq1:32-619(+)
MSYQFFVETDLLFSFALQSFARLRTDHHLDTFGYKQVQVPIVLNSQGQDLFGRLYDFTRIAGVTARALFIDATELTVAYPATASWPHNKATKITVRSPEFQSALNQLGVLQQEIYSRYDQMMPHYRLETEGPPFQRNGIIIASVDGDYQYPVENGSCDPKTAIRRSSFGDLHTCNRKERCRLFEKLQMDHTFTAH